MGDYDRHSKRSRHHKSSKSDKRHESRHSHKTSSRYHDHNDAKTPPLPVELTGTMQDLLKKRESIQRELKRLKSPSSPPPRSSHKKESRSGYYAERSKKDSKLKETNHKRSSRRDYDKPSPMPLKKKSRPEAIIKIDSGGSSNENISIHSDEDEESIIEQRRKQRQKLLEKLVSSKEVVVISEEPMVPANNMTKNNTGDKDNNNVHNENNTNNASRRQGGTDMFADNDDFKINDTNSISTNKSGSGYKDNNQPIADEGDDSSGYYNVKVGETLHNNRFIVKKILGQGVFSNVIHAQDRSRSNMDVAIKILRNNDLMYKTGVKEMSILKLINDTDPDNKYHCVRFLSNFMHRGHLCMVLESMSVDLRYILKKYGKHNGINMVALLSYSRQLLLALKLLKRIGIIHADIKPDNILVNEKKNILKLCDFGSATKVDDNEPTPYLVSRFYRAPEVILGLRYDFGVDLWSSACTIYELATGQIMFTGSSNNKMLKCFMDLKGKISNKLIRKGRFKDLHFNFNNHFLLHKVDELTGRVKVVEMSNINATRNLLGELKHAFKELSTNEDKKLTQLKDFLDKMTVLDPLQRPSIADCLTHPFIRDEIQN